MAEDNPAEKPKEKKRRASRACETCRQRKVQCDITRPSHKNPDGSACCTHCHLDNAICTPAPNKRRKHPSPGPPSRHGSNGVEVPAPASYNPHQPHTLYQNMAPQLANGRFPPNAGYVQTPFTHNATRSVDTLLHLSAPCGDLSRTRIQDTPPPPPLRHAVPGYLKPLPAKYTSADIDYLYQKSALVIPPEPFRNALLHSYVEFVHPYMPLVDIHHILQIVDGDTPAQISLLLFQAMMFAAVAFVDAEVLKANGFTNRRLARKAFFQRVRILYDLDCETERICVLQSTLLMTYWYEAPNEPKDTWHWQAVTNSMIYVLGLHRDPTGSGRTREQKLRKRIWWSCYLRDREIALGMRRPTRLKDEDSSIAMLTEDDFEIEELRPGNSILPASSCLRSVNAQRALAQLCIAKVKVSVCLTSVLSAQYSILAGSPGTESGVMLLPIQEPTSDKKEEFDKCQKELSQWISDAKLSESCNYTGSKPGGGWESSIFVHRALLHMLYSAVLSALNRPQVAPTKPAEGTEAQIIDQSHRDRVKEASIQTIRIAQDLINYRLEHFLPTAGVTVLLPTIIVEMLGMKSSSEEAREAANRGFSTCMTVMNTLQDNYSSARYTILFILSALKTGNLNPPPYGRDRNGPGRPVNTPQPSVPTHLGGDGNENADRNDQHLPHSIRSPSPPPPSDVSAQTPTPESEEGDFEMIEKSAVLAPIEEFSANNGSPAVPDNEDTALNQASGLRTPTPEPHNPNVDPASIVVGPEGLLDFENSGPAYGSGVTLYAAHEGLPAHNTGFLDEWLTGYNFDYSGAGAGGETGGLPYGGFEYEDYYNDNGLNTSPWEFGTDERLNFDAKRFT